MHPLSPALQKGLDELSLSLSDAQQAQLLAYMDLIAKWTKVYNLTAVRDANEMLTHHLLDSLAVVAPLRRELAKLVLPEGQTQTSLLDVGAGAGLPGIVIAITCPEVSVTCVDTVAKKAAVKPAVKAVVKVVKKVLVVNAPAKTVAKVAAKKAAIKKPSPRKA